MLGTTCYLNSYLVIVGFKKNWYGKFYTCIVYVSITNIYTIMVDITNYEIDKVGFH